MKKIGDTAPNFKLLSQNNEVFSLSDNSKTILYFYPKDNTPGCTIEARGFRNFYKEFIQRDILLLGISIDENESHKNFAEKYALPFPILSDKDGKTAKEYGVLRNTGIYKLKNIVQRTTFLIDKDKKILYVWDKIKVDKHPQEILQKIDELYL